MVTVNSFKKKPPLLGGLTAMYRTRPALSWFHDPQIIGQGNPFDAFKTPAAVLAYIYTELSPEGAAEVIAGVIGAGASAESLGRDMIELVEMGCEGLAEQIGDVAESIKRKDIEDIDFLPESLKDTDEVILKAIACITSMKLRERCEGVPIQLRDTVNPKFAHADLHSYRLDEVFPKSGALIKALEAAPEA
jgi:hypothetical protein